MVTDKIFQKIYTSTFLGFVDSTPNRCLRSHIKVYFIYIVTIDYEIYISHQKIFYADKNHICRTVDISNTREQHYVTVGEAYRMFCTFLHANMNFRKVKKDKLSSIIFTSNFNDPLSHENGHFILLTLYPLQDEHLSQLKIFSQREPPI